MVLVQKHLLLFSDVVPFIALAYDNPGFHGVLEVLASALFSVLVGLFLVELTLSNCW